MQSPRSYERFAEALIESGLYDGAKAIANSHGVSLRDVWQKFGSENVCATRQEIIEWLRSSYKKSNGEIERLLQYSKGYLKRTAYEKKKEKADAYGEEEQEQHQKEHAGSEGVAREA